MYTWVYYVIYAVIALYSYTRQPKPPKPSPGQAQRPVTEEGKAIVEVFGDVVIEAPVVLYFEDLDPIPIKGKGKK